MPSERVIRVGAKAVIVRDDHVLLIKYDDDNGPHYNFPGGGHHDGESLLQTVVREVREEASADIAVGRLVMVQEYEPLRAGGFAGTTHMLNLFFECSLLGDSEPEFPDNPDPFQIGIEWIPMSQLDYVAVLPKFGQQLREALEGSIDLYYADHLDR